MDKAEEELMQLDGNKTVDLTIWKKMGRMRINGYSDDKNSIAGAAFYGLVRWR